VVVLQAIAVALVAFVGVSVSGDPEADAEPSRYGGGFGGYGVVSYRPVYSSYGYGRWKRSAEPVAEAEAEPEADPSRFGYGHGGFSHVSFQPVYSSYGYGRWKRSAEAEPGFSFGHGFGGHGRFGGYRGYGGHGGSFGGHGRFYG